MGKYKWLLLLLLLTLALAACGGEPTPTDPPAPPQTEVPVPTVPEEPAPTEDEPQPEILDHLTVELVVDWSDSDQMLTQLSALSDLLIDALAQECWEVEDITVTVSTAGGFTGEALAGGGVDIALLPAVDYLAWESGAAAVLTDSGEIPAAVVAVTNARAALDDSFRAALADALTQQAPGREFMAAWCGEQTFVPAAEDALQALREQMAEEGNA